VNDDGDGLDLDLDVMLVNLLIFFGILREPSFMRCGAAQSGSASQPEVYRLETGHAVSVYFQEILKRMIVRRPISRQ
jgi:hypothetical protein